MNQKYNFFYFEGQKVILFIEYVNSFQRGFYLKFILVCFESNWQITEKKKQFKSIKLEETRILWIIKVIFALCIKIWLRGEGLAISNDRV